MAALGQAPLHVLSARLQSETPVSGVILEPYILVRRADGTAVSAGPNEIAISAQFVFFFKKIAVLGVK